jgi:serine protease Do
MGSIKTRGRRFKIMSALLAGTILGGGGMLLSSALAESTPATAPLAGTTALPQAGFADLVAKVKPAVVNIATTRKSMPETDSGEPSLPFGPENGAPFQHRGGRPGQALGSGVIVDPAGHVVTNNHVIDGASKITVTLDDGTSYTAKLVGHDAKTDLALLKIDASKPLPWVAFGDSSRVRIGDWVVAVGNPFGLGGTVTAGIVSGHDRNIDSGPFDDYLQIDAPINPGNSGGPLFNQAGQVIGIDTAIYSPSGGSVGIGFAIPSSLAEGVIAQLKDHGTVERGWLGIQMQPVTPTLAKALGLSKDEGVLVNEVQPDSPAAIGKLMQGDVIRAFNDAVLKTPRDLAVAVANARAGSKAKLTVWRSGHDQTLEVAIGTQAKEQVAADTAKPDYAPVGMTLAPLTSDTRSELGLKPGIEGVVVAGVKPDSRAAESGIETGDVIVRVGSEAVKSPDEAAAKIRAAQRQKKEAVPLLVSRDGTTYYLALQLASS